MGLSQCKTLLSQINRRIESYENIPVFSFAQKLPLFDSNSTKLKLNSQTNEMMMELLSLVERNKEKKILIVGHSDNTGSSSMNMALSEQRALALRDWLIKRSDITVDNFITKGMGLQNRLRPITRKRVENKTDASKYWYYPHKIEQEWRSLNLYECYTFNLLNFEGTFLTPAPVLDRSVNILMFRDPDNHEYNIIINRTLLEEEDTSETFVKKRWTHYAINCRVFRLKVNSSNMK